MKSKYKIIVIEDNVLLTKVIEKELKVDERFEVISFHDAESAISALEKKDYDLVITDIQLPEKDGIYIIETIRNEHKCTQPIIVISANEKDEMVVKALSVGANEYLQKPAGFNQLLVRVYKLLDIPLAEANLENRTQGKINAASVGIVIPCYNEEKRLLKEEFADFIKQNSSYHLCFVNDGSTDHTLEVLKNFEATQEGISVYNCEKNGGKAEAVRLGMNHLLEQGIFEYIGFLDADLSTDFEDFEDFINIIKKPEIYVVCGSRISRIGANISKSESRAIISNMINKIIQFIIKMPFQDTQCGAKIFEAEVVKNIFDTPFLSRWLFDVEIFIRMRKFYGKEQAKTMIVEQPLKRWVHMDGSKLSFKDSLNIFSELFKIWKNYR